MDKITLTDSERMQLVQLSVSDFASASMLASLPLSRKPGATYGSQTGHSRLVARQNLSSKLEGLRKVEISRSANSLRAQVTHWDFGEGDVEMVDIYASSDSCQMLRDLMGAVQLREDFLKFYEVYDIEPAIELRIDDMPWVNAKQLAVLMRCLSSLTGVTIEITGHSLMTIG